MIESHAFKKICREMQRIQCEMKINAEKYQQISNVDNGNDDNDKNDDKS